MCVWVCVWAAAQQSQQHTLEMLSAAPGATDRCSPWLCWLSLCVSYWSRMRLQQWNVKTLQHLSEDQGVLLLQHQSIVMLACYFSETLSRLEISLVSLWFLSLLLHWNVQESTRHPLRAVRHLNLNISPGSLPVEWIGVTPDSQCTSSASMGLNLGTPLPPFVEDTDQPGRRWREWGS